MTDNNSDQYLKMTQAPVEKLVLKLAGPSIVSMLITAVYNMADTFFVGQISTESTAAVGVVFALMSIIQAIGFFFGQGSGVLVSRLLGMKKNNDAAQAVSTGFFFSIFGGAILSILGLCFIQPLALLLGATDSFIAQSCDYMFYILLAAPLMVASFTMNNQLRFQGYSMYGMIGILVGGLLNIVLDPLFIFGVGMGAGGAALATAISQAVSFVILFIMIQQKAIKIHIKNICVKKNVLLGIVSGGLPSLARQSGAGIGVMIFNNIAGIYGAAAIAAMSIVTRIMMFAGFIMIGYGQGFQPVCGYNYGAGLYSRVKKAYIFCVKSSLIFLIAASVILAVFAPQLIAVFRNDQNVVDIGTVCLRCQCISFVLFGVITLTNMTAQSTAKTVRATLLSMGRTFIFFVPCVLILNSCLGILGLELSQMCADILTFVFCLPVIRSIFREFDSAIASGVAT